MYLVGPWQSSCAAVKEGTEHLSLVKEALKAVID